MKEIRLIEQTRYPTPTKLIVDNPPRLTAAPQLTGQQGFIRVQWIPVSNVDGYDVAIMTSANLDAPDVNIARVMGDKNREWHYPCGNVALTRYFAVRTFIANYFSDWSPVASATSVVYGAVEGAPPAPPASAPTGSESLPTGAGGVGRVSRISSL